MGKKNIDIDSLTIGQVRKIAALIGLTAPGDAPTSEGAGKTASNALASFIGKDVILRSSPSGVWAGTVEDVNGDTVILGKGARRAWYWTGAGSCSGLAQTGPTGGKWPAPSSGNIAVLEVCEVIEATPEAMKAVADQPVWTGRES